MPHKDIEQFALDIAKRLTALRLQKTWTRDMLAEQAGINVYSLKRFELTGRIAFKRLLAICDALDVLGEMERLFKPRQRISIDQWAADDLPARKRGRREKVS